VLLTGQDLTTPQHLLFGLAAMIVAGGLHRRYRGQWLP
jgi:hypothetical protein